MLGCRRILICGIFFGFICLNTFAVQVQNNLDSLLQITHSSSVHDSVKVRANILLGRAYENSDLDSAMAYYRQAMNLAESPTMEAFPKFKGLVLENIGFAYIYGKGETNEGISYLKKALESHLEKGLLSEANKTEFNIGFFYSGDSDYNSAVYHYNRVIARNDSTTSNDRLHESYNNAGLLYFYLGQFGRSAEYLTKAIRLKEETGETSEILHTYMNLGTTFEAMKLYERAKRYYSLSVSGHEEVNDTSRAMTGKQNIAFLLIEQDSLIAAKRIMEELLPVYEKKGNQFGVSNFYRAMGMIADKNEQFIEAHDYYEKAIEVLYGNVNDRYGSSIMTRLGNAKLTLAQHDYLDRPKEKMKLINEAILLGEEAFKRADRSQLLSNKLSSALLLADAYNNTNQLENAFKYAQIAIKLTNEINDREQSQAIAQVTFEYETDRVEGENALLLEKQKRQTAQIKQQGYLIAASSAVLVLIIVIAFIVQRSRLKLKKANSKIEKSLEEKELLLKEIHHRVKNNLQVVSSLLDLQSRGIEDEKALSTFMEGQNRVKAMALIHQKLYQNEDLATIDFAEYAKQLMTELASIYTSSSEVKTEVHAQGKTNFDIDTAIPLGLILNELISNAYKYAFKEGEGALSISIEALGNGKHQLTVSDSGVGLPQDFDFNKAKSLGLRLVRRLSKQLYGSAEYYYEQGSKFIVTFTDTLERKAV